MNIISHVTIGNNDEKLSYIVILMMTMTNCLAKCRLPSRLQNSLRRLMLQLFVVGLVLTELIGKGGCSIHHKVHHFEIIEDVRVHSIATRNSHHVEPDLLKVVTFSTLHRNFKLLLKTKTGLFSEDFQALVTTDQNEKFPVNVSAMNFYSGTVDDDDNSKVFAHWEDSMLFATIATREDNYVVEPAWRHLDEQSNANSMIFYRESDVINENGRNSTLSGRSAFTKCGNEEKRKIIMRENILPKIGLANSHDRNRRAVSTAKSACSLLLVADFRFHQIFGNGQPLKTANYMIAVIGRVNNLFRSINWDDSQLKELGFIIEEIQIHSSPTIVPNGNLHYNMKGHTWEPTELLKAFSKGSWHGRFCLSHLFTYQSFDDNVVGLAYTASPRPDIAGGICSPLVKSGEQYFSYNTGWSSYENVDKKRILLKEAILITTHGHNWGSEHDPSSGSCSPSSLMSKGKYLMYPYSVNGYEPNNKKFSFCSKTYMAAVLLNKRILCFKEKPKYQTCGNGQLDKGEQCDGGYLSLIGQDPCCDKSCNFIGDAICSSMQGSCCINCQIEPANTLCHEDIMQDVSCLGNSHCDGVTVRCPLQPHKQNGTNCIESGTCYEGVCVSFCEARGLISCICNDVAASCLRCCRVNSTSPCEKYNSTLFLSDGRPCLQGYCQNGVCKKTIKNLIQRLFKFSSSLSISKLMEFFRTNIVGSVIVFSLFFWVPVCFYIEYRDKLQEKQERKEGDIIENLKKKNDSVLTHGPVIQSTEV